MGVAAARVLAEREHEVIGLDRYGVASDLSSSAHLSRIFRLAYAEPEYVRLGRRALRAWRELEQRDGATLLVGTGLLELGGPHDQILETVRGEGASVEELDGGDVARVFPELRPRPGVPARFHPAAGVLRARDAILLQADHAARSGAEIAVEERVMGLEPLPSGVRVRTDRRTVEVDVAVVCAGPWTNQLLEPIGLAIPLEPGLGQASYFRGGDWQQRPCVIDYGEDGVQPLYGLPTEGVGYKIGFDTHAPFDPDDTSRRVDRLEATQLGERVAEDFPGFQAKPVSSDRCPWTMTADGDFVFDRSGSIVFGAGCSGHAFKFSPAIGEVLADLVEERPRTPDLERFRANRASLIPDGAFPTALIR